VNKIGAQNHFDGTCMETVPMAIRCFLESQNFEEAIRYAVMADGDTDTKAAITGTLAEAFYEVPMEFIEKALSYLPSDMLDIVNQYYDRLEAKLE
jgi:ADP-ribosylglycohydrolase